MIDIVPELLEKIHAAFSDGYDTNDKIKKLLDILKSGKSTYKDANEYAIEVGQALADAFGSSLSSSALPDGKMYYNIAKRILNDVMGNNFELVSDFAAETQDELNKAAGIGIKAQRAKLNQDKIDGLINRLSSEDDFDKASWLLQEPVVNFSQSIVDDTIRENVEFHAKAGLSPKIVRTSTGKCCEWCDKLAGVYDYKDVRNTGNDVFRRHQRCRCTVEYDPGDGKRQNVWSKKLVSQEEKELRESRKKFGLVPSAKGTNFFRKGFSKTELIKHFDKHKNEFPGITIEQYNQAALNLLQKATNEDILGYRTLQGAIVRYKKSTNEFAKGYPKTGVATYFKPRKTKEKGLLYYLTQLKKEGIVDD